MVWYCSRMYKFIFKTWKRDIKYAAVLILLPILAVVAYLIIEKLGVTVTILLVLAVLAIAFSYLPTNGS